MEQSETRQSGLGQSGNSPIGAWQGEAKAEAFETIGGRETSPAGSQHAGSKGSGFGGRLPWLETTLRRWLLDARTRRAAGSRADGQAAPAAPAFAAGTAAAVTHDLRNLLASLDLYCDLLAEPGVLSAGSEHYATDLHQVAEGCHRMLLRLSALNSLDALSNLDGHNGHDALNHLDALNRQDTLAGAQAGLAAGPAAGRSQASQTAPAAPASLRREVPSLARRARSRVLAAGEPVHNVAEDVLATKSLLAALAGPAITVGMHFDGGARSVDLAAEDLTRILVNLVKNASEAMPTGGHIQIGVEEREHRIRLTVADTGCGIPDDALEAIFSPGFSSRIAMEPDETAWPVRHQGLGLAIVRSLAEAAGGQVWAANREPGAVFRSGGGAVARSETGAQITLELPIRTAL